MTTQIKWVKDQLESTGRVSRNDALSNYFSRLAARIADLEEDGWVFTTEKDGGDYVYVMVSRPATKQLTMI